MVFRRSGRILDRIFEENYKRIDVFLGLYLLLRCVEGASALP